MSVTTYLQQSSFDDGIAVVLMVTNHNGEVTNTRRIVFSNWCWLTDTSYYQLEADRRTNITSGTGSEVGQIAALTKKIQGHGQCQDLQIQYFGDEISSRALRLVLLPEVGLRQVEDLSG